LLFLAKVKEISNAWHTGGMDKLLRNDKKNDIYMLDFMQAAIFPEGGIKCFVNNSASSLLQDGFKNILNFPLLKRVILKLFLINF
jgi:hypothetical protein